MIEMGKQYRTRDGREVRIYAVEAHQVHGAFLDSSTGHWQIQSWQTSGAWITDDRHPLDLFEVRPKITRMVWLEHWPSSNPSAFHSRLALDDHLRAIGCTPLAITGPHEITFEGGESLPAPSTPKEP